MSDVVESPMYQWGDRGTDVMDETNCLLIGFNIHSAEGNPCLELKIWQRNYGQGAH